MRHAQYGRTPVGDGRGPVLPRARQRGRPGAVVACRSKAPRRFEVLKGPPAGVGELVRIGVEKGRDTQPTLKTGVCGEHGGDPASVAFCHEVGLDYVSCSPYRVPIARLAAAQAALGKEIASQA